MTWNSTFKPVFLNLSFIENNLSVVFLVLSIIYLALFILRLLRVMKKRTCPSCQGKLSRKPRNPFDKLVVILTLNILPFRRYKCVHCGWEGLRWSAKKYRARDAY